MNVLDPNPQAMAGCTCSVAGWDPERSWRLWNGGCGFAPELAMIEVGVELAAFEEFGVSSAFRNLSVLEHDDAVGPAHGRKPVRDEEGRAALGQSVQGLQQSVFGFDVERAGRLVEDQNGRVLQQGARNRNALALAAGERRPALADHGVVAVGQTHDELVRV